MYAVILDALSVEAVCELFNIIAPSDAIVVIHRITITQDSSETSEQLPLNVFRTATDQSAKGTSNTPNPLQSGDAAFGGTVRTNVLTAETFATETTMLRRESQNVLNGWDIVFTPEERPIISPSGRLCIKLDAAPGSSTPFSGTVIFEEIGG